MLEEAKKALEQIRDLNFGNTVEDSANESGEAKNIAISALEKIDAMGVAGRDAAKGYERDVAVEVWGQTIGCGVCVIDFDEACEDATVHTNCTPETCIFAKNTGITEKYKCDFWMFWRG